MIGRKKLLSIVALLSVLLIVPLVFSFGGVDVPKLLFGGSPEDSGEVEPANPSTVEPASSSTPTVFVDPVNILDETKQSGSLVTFHVNVSDVTDLFAWQVNVTWDTAILNVSRIIPSEFLATSADLTSSEILGFVINSTGSVLAAEAIMADTTGISGSGRLVSIEFEVVGYGSTDLTVSVSGTLSTMLLDSAGGSVIYVTTDGYFSNKIPGDVDGDGDVDRYDFLDYFLPAYGSKFGDDNYNPECDLDRDGDVDRYDFLDYFLPNYGR